MKASKRLFLTLLLCIVCILQVSATIYRIEGYDISIIGRTREAAIRRLIGYDEGIEFQSLQELEDAVEKKRQILLDKRIFKSVTASVDYGPEKDSTVPATVKIGIDGAFSFLVLPSVYYDSNYGLFYQLFVEDQNFLGTTDTTKFSFIIRENDNEHSVEHSDIISYISSELPLGRYWNLFMKASLHHWALDHEKTRLSFENTVYRNLFESGFIKNSLIVTINPESEMRSGWDIVTDFVDTFNFAHDKYATWEISHLMTTEFEEKLTNSHQTTLGGYLNMDSFTALKLTPWIKWHYFSGSDSSDSNAFEFGFKAADSNVSWYLDMRRGYSYDVDAFVRTDGVWQVLADARVYYMPFDWMQISSRAVMRLSDYPDVEQTEFYTEYLRGIPNINTTIHEREIDSIAALNLDVLFKLFRIPKIVRAYANPFIDFGLVFPNEFLVGAGAEIMLIFDEWPGSPVRLSYGRNLMDSDEYELAITVFFFY